MREEYQLSPMTPPMMWMNELRNVIFRDAMDHGLYDEISYKLDEELRVREAFKLDYKKRQKVLREILARRLMDEVDELLLACDDEEHYNEEWADCLILLLSIAGRLRIDADAETRRKMEINHNRPWKHGKQVDDSGIRRIYF